MDEFLDSLPPKMATKALLELKLLSEKGPALREPHSKAVGSGLFELRIKVGSDIGRTFYFFVRGSRIIVTNGFIKKTRRTPRQEFNRARQMMKDWTERHYEEYKEAWQSSEPEYEIMRLLVEGRQERGLSQHEVAKHCGMQQSNISRLETGGGNPTVATLKKLAQCFGKRLEIRFVDPANSPEALSSQPTCQQESA